MVARRWFAVVLLGALASLAAEARTPNFVVEAATPQIAQRIGEWAEYYRREKALQWLGKEMPTWGQPCPLRVTVTYNGSGGATSFAFDNGRILSIDMHIEGTLDRLVASVLPHEVTHTVFAYHFRCPVPRWADEGGSVLSEDEQERQRHDQLVREILNTPGRAIPLRRLFSLTQYPRDVMVLYAEGYSVVNFLVPKKPRRQDFLAFVGDGMRSGWDVAVQRHYGYRNVEELEQAWLQHLRERRPAQTTLASAGGRHNPANGPATTTRALIRQTLPPVLPILGEPRPVARGVPGEEEGVTTPLPDQTEAGWNRQPATSSQPRSMPPLPQLGIPRATPMPAWNPVQ
jgi:hypothetical protein